MSVSRGRVAIWTGPDPVAWSARDLERSGLGGTETAAVRVAEELSRIGFEVTVHGRVEAGSWRGAVYAPPEDLEPRGAALLWMRIPEPALLSEPDRNIAWVHARDLGDDVAAEHVDRLDSVLAVSEWHRDLISARHPALGDRIEVVGNGVELDLFHPSGSEVPAGEPRVLFTSQPERGLDVLLELLPEVRAQVPGAELCWCYAPIYDGIADRPWVARHRDRIAELADQPGATALGSLPKHELAELMRRSRVWAHPSWATPYSTFFDETSCIAAMEAQAVGLAVVASSYGALPETVRVGSLIDPEGAPGDPWRGRLLAAIVAGLTDPGVARTAASRGPAAMASRGWDSVAASIARVIEGGGGR